MPVDAATFAERNRRALINMYHGDIDDRAVDYEVVRGRLPEGLTGRALTTVFPYERVTGGDGYHSSPNLLTAPACVLAVDFAGGARDGKVAVSTHLVRNEAWHLRAVAPQAFVRSDFAEFSWFGTSNLSNTTAVPMFGAGADGAASKGVRLLLSYDAGRPIEIDPLAFGYVTPIGRPRDYEPAVGGIFAPMVMTTGHPAYDPEFDGDKPRLLFTNLVPRVTSFLTVDTPIAADLYVSAWDGERGPARPVRVRVGGEPVVMEQASAHQLCVTRNHLVILQASLVLDTASLLKPLLPLVRERWKAGQVPLWFDMLDRVLTRQLRAAVQPSSCAVYVIAKRDLRRALDEPGGSVEAKRVRLDWEATHAVADYDDDDGVITLFAQHNVGGDPAEGVDRGDALMTGGVADPGLEGMFSASTDLNQVRRHRIDAARGRLLDTIAFPEAGDEAHFAFGLNLLPPLQLMPYRRRGSAPYDLAACAERLTHSYWVAGGWPPATSVARVFEAYRKARAPAPGRPARRLVPYDEYLARVRNVDNVVRFFRLDRDLRVESSFAFEPGVLMGAPLFVPRADAATVDQGWLVGQVWHHDLPYMELWVWDASLPLDRGPACVLGPSRPSEGIRPGFPLHSSWVDDESLHAWSRPTYHAPAIEVPAVVKVAEVVTVVGSVASTFLRQVFSG